jgi:hypothetical protein
LETFKEKLAQRTDSFADACAHYSRSYDEFPPDEMYYLLLLHRELYSALVEKPKLEFFKYYNEVYLKKYGYNVIWYLDDIISENLKTEIYVNLAALKPRFYIDNFEISLGDQIYYSIENSNPFNFDGSVALIVTKENLFGNIIFSGVKAKLNPENWGWNFNYIKPVKVTSFNFIFENSQIATEKTILNDNDIIVYEDYNGQIFEMLFKTSDYLFGDETDELTIRDLVTWSEYDFYSRQTEQLNVKKLFVKKTFKTPTL